MACHPAWSSLVQLRFGCRKKQSKEVKNKGFTLQTTHLTNLASPNPSQLLMLLANPRPLYPPRLPHLECRSRCRERCCKPPPQLLVQVDLQATRREPPRVSIGDEKRTPKFYLTVFLYMFLFEGKKWKYVFLFRILAMLRSSSPIRSPTWAPCQRVQVLSRQSCTSPKPQSSATGLLEATRDFGAQRGHQKTRVLAGFGSKNSMCQKSWHVLQKEIHLKPNKPIKPAKSRPLAAPPMRPAASDGWSRKCEDLGFIASNLPRMNFTSSGFLQLKTSYIFPWHFLGLTPRTASGPLHGRLCSNADGWLSGSTHLAPKGRARFWS